MLSYQKIWYDLIELVDIYDGCIFLSLKIWHMSSIRSNWRCRFLINRLKTCIVFNLKLIQSNLRGPLCMYCYTLKLGSRKEIKSVLLMQFWDQNVTKFHLHFRSCCYSPESVETFQHWDVSRFLKQKNFHSSKAQLPISKIWWSNFPNIDAVLIFDSIEILLTKYPFQ